MVQTNTMDNRYFIYLYKNRFLLLYVLFGFLSLSSELILRSLLQNIMDTNIANFLAVGSGILIAYFLNVNFNFKVPKNRIRISIIYFVLVSLLSIFIQYTIGNFTQINFFQNRFLLSGALFFIAYLLHRKITFRDYQKVGIAIHLNKINIIDDIYNLVGNYPDFIQADLIDSTYNKDNVSTDLEKLDEIASKWPGKKIQLHIMSKNPSEWINKVKNRDLEIFFHQNDGQNPIQIKNNFAELNIGIVIEHDNTEAELKNMIQAFSNIMILCIEKVGESGQEFSDKYDPIIKKLIELTKNKKNKITLDGGMTPNIASKYNVAEVVTASSVLGNPKSKLQIINFQTSQKYEHEL